MITVYHEESNYIHYNTTKAFVAGLKFLGVDCQERSIGSGYHKSDVIVLFGYIKGQKARSRIIQRHDDPSSTIIIERGFIGRGSNQSNIKESYYSVGIGEFNGKANFRNKNSLPDRWLKLNIDIKPLNTGGKNVVLLGQVLRDASLLHVDYDKWLNATYEYLNMKCENVLFKPHPLMKTSGPTNGNHLLRGKNITKEPLEEVLAEAKYTVAFNSNSGVESILAGVPSVSIDKRSMIYNISSHDIFDPQYPTESKLLEWAYNIAYAQWTTEEMAQGLPQEHLGLIKWQKRI